MSLHLDRTSWTRVRLGDVVNQSKENVDPADGSVERYVAGGHMNTDDLAIHHWGDVKDGYLGPAFHRRFRPGQVLYGSRRTYLRKVAVAEFDGVCANTTFVLESKNQQALLARLLPFVLTTEAFHAFSISESKGSVNPYVNWSDLARYEFDLPPLDQQQRIADLLWCVETEKRASATVAERAMVARDVELGRQLGTISAQGDSVALESLIVEGRPICYGILMPGLPVEGGVPVIKVKDFPDGYVRTEDLLLTDPEIALAYRRSTLRPGDLLISIRGTVGRVAEVPKELDGANITQDTARLSIASDHNADYVRLALESNCVQAQFKRMTTGLAVKGLNIGALRQVQIPVPTSAEQEALLLQRARQLGVSVTASYDRARAAQTLAVALLREVVGAA